MNERGRYVPEICTRQTSRGWFMEVQEPDGHVAHSVPLFLSGNKDVDEEEWRSKWVECEKIRDWLIEHDDEKFDIGAAIRDDLVNYLCDEAYGEDRGDHKKAFNREQRSDRRDDWYDNSDVVYEDGLEDEDGDQLPPEWVSC